MRSKIHARIADWVVTPWFWIVLIGIPFGWAIGQSVLAEAQLPEQRPVLGTVPDFTLLDHHGDPRGSGELRGRIWIAAFVAAGCEDCPDVADRMADIQHRSRGLGDFFRMVMLTVDPERDTVEVMATLADKRRVSRGRWWFLSGKPERARQVAAALAPPNAGDLAALARGYHFVLVDSQMQVRGHYDLTDAGEVDRILRDAGLLVNRGG